MNPTTNTTQKQTGMVTAYRVNDLLRQNKKQEVPSQELQINYWIRTTFSQMLMQMFQDLK